MMCYPHNSTASLKVHYSIHFFWYFWTVSNNDYQLWYEQRMQSWFSLKYHPSTLPIFTYSLTPWTSILLEKLTGSQLVKKCPVFYGTQRFISIFTSAHHLSLSCARHYPYRDKIGQIPLECQEVTQQHFIAVRMWASTAPADEVQRGDIAHAKHCKVLNQINRFTETSRAWYSKALKTVTWVHVNNKSDKDSKELYHILTKQ
jgi:hypothetical protein